MAQPKRTHDWSSAVQTLHDSRADLVTLVTNLQAGLAVHGYGDLHATMGDALTTATNGLARLEVATRAARERLAP